MWVRSSRAFSICGSTTRPCDSETRYNRCRSHPTARSSKEIVWCSPGTDRLGEYVRYADDIGVAPVERLQAELYGQGAPHAGRKIPQQRDTARPLLIAEKGEEAAGDSAGTP